MPTLLRAFEKRRVASKKETADLKAVLLLIPLIACLFSIILAVECRAYEDTFVQTGLE